MLFASFLAVALSLLPTFADALSHSSPRRHHSSTHNITQGTGVEKRAANYGQFSYYDATGTGACGKTLDPSAFIVALNADQFEGGKHCFETVTMTWQGNQVQATIADECASGCGYGGLDLSPPLFKQLTGSLDAGLVQGDWDFGSGAGGDEPSPKPSPSPSPSPKTTHHTTSTPPPKPTTTSKEADSTTITTTSKAKPSSTTSSTVRETSSSAAATSSSVSQTSSAAAPTFSDPAAVTVGMSSTQGVLGSLNLAMIQMGVLVESAGWS